MSKPDFSLDSVNVIGKARHGKLQGSTLTLDVDGSSYATAAYTGTGDTTYVKTGFSRINRTPEQAAEDIAGRLEWRDDCVFYGANRDYSVDARNKGLGANGALYTDGNGNNWLINFASTIQGGGTADYTVSLKNLFGRFGGYNAPHRNKQLSTQAISPVPSASIYGFDPKRDIYQNPNGSKVLVHVRSTGNGNLNLVGLQEVWEVTIAGNGFVPTQASEDGLLGDGITATWAQLKSFDDCYSNMGNAGVTGGWENQHDQVETFDPEPPFPSCIGVETTRTLSITNYATGPTRVYKSNNDVDQIVRVTYDKAGVIQVYSVLSKSGTEDISEHTGSTSWDSVGVFDWVDGGGACIPPEMFTTTTGNISGTWTKTVTRKDGVIDLSLRINGVEKKHYYQWVERQRITTQTGPTADPDVESSRLVVNGDTIAADSVWYGVFNRSAMVGTKVLTSNVVTLFSEIFDTDGDPEDIRLESKVTAAAYGATSDELSITGSDDPRAAKASFNPKTNDITLVSPSEDQPVYL